MGFTSLRGGACYGAVACERNADDGENIKTNDDGGIGHVHNYRGSWACTVCGERLIPSNGLAYIISSDGTYCMVSGMGSCSDTVVVIPYTYNGLPVTGIIDVYSAAIDDTSADTAQTDAAFTCQTGITEVYLPDSITYIGENAFFGYSSLTSITLPDGAAYIGDYVFHPVLRLQALSCPAARHT